MLKLLRAAKTLRMALLCQMLTGLLLATLMSASPELHKYLHHDADDEDHECLATVLLHSGCEGAPEAVFAVHRVLEPSFLVLKPEPISVGSFFLKCSILEHAPPVLS